MMMHEKAHLIQGFDRKMVEEISNHTQMIDFFNLLSQFKDVNEVNSLEVRDILDIDAELVSEYKSKCTDFIDATGDLTMEKEQKGLIEEKGRLDLPGRPLVYGTTDRFLRCFSLNSLDDLPDLPEDTEEKDDSQTSLFEDNDESKDSALKENDVLKGIDEEDS